MLPGEVSPPTRIYPSDMDRLLPLMKPITLATEYFGGTDKSLCTWSSVRCPSSPVHSFYSATDRNTGPSSRRNCACRAFRRYFGMKHYMILAFPNTVFETFVRLHHLLPFVNFERFTKRRLQTTPGAVKLWESSSRAGGFPIGLSDPRFSQGGTATFRSSAEAGYGTGPQIPQID